MTQSIIAVVVPMVAWGLLWVAGNSAATALFPAAYQESIPQTAPLLCGIILYSVVLSVLAGFVCAKIAPHQPMRHVLVLACIQLLIGIGVQAGAWTQMPLWYHLVFLGCVVPAHLIGGQWSIKQSGRTGF